MDFDEMRVNGRMYDHIHWTIRNAESIDEYMGTTTDADPEKEHLNGKIYLVGRNAQGFHDRLSKYMSPDEYKKAKGNERQCIMEFKGG